MSAAWLPLHASAQDGQIPSPPAHAACKFSDGKSIDVNYSSPRMRGRKIYGGLVPYGEPWRAGANAATTFVVDAAVSVAGVSVPARGYTLFALPGANGWKLIISRETGEWGIPYPGDSHDFARVPMRVSKLPAPVENFKISFEQSSGTCTMNLDWETTRASVAISEKK